MLTQWRLWVLGVVALLALVLATDWMLAIRRLDDIRIETSLQPPGVVADGKSSTVLTVRVTEGGEPRSNDLLQLWLGPSGGLLRPTWVYTDQDGTARITYQPNPPNAYEPQDVIEVHIMDTSIGRLIEVGKRHQVQIPLVEPEQ